MAINETVAVHEDGNHPLVSWRSVLAGLLVGMLTMWGLTGLGMGVGGITLEDGARASNAGLFIGIWAMVSLVISIFAGSYFAARISRFQNARIGSAQGLVIASLFLGIVAWQGMMTAGILGAAAGSVVSGAAQVAGAGMDKAAESPMVRNMVEDAIGDLNLRADPQTVATGVMSRLVQGNPDSARAYLIRQSGLSEAEANQRMAALQSQVNQAMVQAREAAATALNATGWSLFATIVFSVLAAVGGGALGSRLNFRKPLAVDTYATTRTAGLRPSTI